MHAQFLMSAVITGQQGRFLALFPFITTFPPPCPSPPKGRRFPPTPGGTVTK